MTTVASRTITVNLQNNQQESHRDGYILLGLGLAVIGIAILWGRRG